ncbi:unannotated protein [freshwater metagenome]|uniref:Unannotated protein n=1 Tax=freshwater metagenome TaxID=449393 RepID=A0A6J6T855_9ZZZZ|nr:oligosaccharide flippase family protein [Actinomycetota bacterium]
MAESRAVTRRRTASPLVSAFLALASSHVVRTLAGFVFWVLVARLSPAVEVGVAGAVVATVTLLSRFTSLGLGSFLMAELPRLEAAPARRLVRVGTGAVVAVTTPVALLWCGAALLLDPGAGSSAGAAVASLAVAVLLVATTVATTVTSVWDYAALGLRRPGAQLTRNLVAAFGRFPLLLAWSLLGDVDAAAILTCWFVPLLASGLVLAVQVRLAQGRRSAADSSRDLLLAHWRTSLGHWLLDVALAAGPLLVPVVAAAALAPRENAFFTMAWMAASVVFVAPFALATSLFADAAQHGPDAFAARCRRVLPVGLGLVLAGCVGTWVVGPLFFRVFGEEYVDASLPVMSVLVLGGFWMVVKDLLLDWYRLGRRFALATGVALTATVLDVAGALVGGFVLGDGRGVAVGWVGASALQLLLASPLVLGFVRRMLAARPEADR